MLNPGRGKPEIVIETAKHNFQIFLEKLQGQFFVITLPEGVDPQNREFDDFYGQLQKKETSEGSPSVSVIEERQTKIVEVAINTFINQIQFAQTRQAKILANQTKNDEKWFFDRFLGMNGRELQQLVIF